MADGVETSPCVGGEAETVSEQLPDVAGETKTTDSDSSDSKEEKEEMKNEQEVSTKVMPQWPLIIHI